MLTIVIASIVYGAKYQHTTPGRSWISFSAGEFLCKRHFWQSQRPKGGFILTEGWFADRGPDSFHRHSGISDIRHRTKALQKHIRDVETYSRCIESSAPDHILDDIWSYTKVGKNNVIRCQSRSLLTLIVQQLKRSSPVHFRSEIKFFHDVNHSLLKLSYVCMLPSLMRH